MKLGQQLDLEESPALVVAAAAAGKEAVLVVDQLDAVSTTSGRSSSFVEAVEGLLAEARGLRYGLKLHVIVVCRSFDWDNDHRLRQLLSEKHTKIEVTEFSQDEVRALLSAEGFNGELFGHRQIELLRLPQNLSLFLDAVFDPEKAPKFSTAKELFDRYWDVKRDSVAQRAAPLTEQWPEVVQLLCEEMTRTQQLSVPREKLDRFAGNFVAQMASENVLTFDGRRYGFGHESFFDYCFARAFVAKEQSLTEFIVQSEQHIFRRAQVRQVLAYLREADLVRYCHELRELLSDPRIRFHLKDLALALAVSVPDPSDSEWTVLEPWLKSEIKALESGQKNQDKFASLVWQHFFTSTSWFCIADNKGCIISWLASESGALPDMAVSYLRFHQKHSGDRVAELLEPHVGKSDHWSMRLRFVMQWAHHENSRRFFNLFLRLIDDGTLDNARDPIASNGTFWTMFNKLGEEQPRWMTEVIAHWLIRRACLIQPLQMGEKVNWGDLFNHDNFASKHFHDAAAKAPEAFVQHVLPVLLEISDAAIYESKSSPPKPDFVWPVLRNMGYESPEGACRNALTMALKALAKNTAEILHSVVPELQRRETSFANFLLLSAYTAGAEHFANNAATLLCEVGSVGNSGHQTDYAANRCS
jgi:hypothetical protein